MTCGCMGKGFNPTPESSSKPNKTPFRHIVFFVFVAFDSPRLEHTSCLIIITLTMMNDERATWKITAWLEEKPLLIAVNCLAGLAIFFFGATQSPYYTFSLDHLELMLDKKS